MKKLFDEITEYCRTKSSGQIEMILEIIKPLYEKQDKTILGFPNKYRITETHKQSHKELNSND